MTSDVAHRRSSGRKVFKGTPAAPGVATGAVYVLREERIVVHDRVLAPDEIPLELRKFDLAVDEARKEVTILREKIRKRVGESEARVFDAHLLLMEDEEFVGSVRKAVVEEARDASFLLRRRCDELRTRMLRIPDSYLRERVTDLDDVTERIIRYHVRGERRKAIELREPSILVCHNLTPSALSQIHRRNILGIATDLGGPTSHVAILARAMHLPAVAGLQVASHGLRTGDQAALDGNAGTLVLNPTGSEVEAMHSRKEALERFQLELFSLRDLPCTTMDGRPVVLTANIELPVEVDNAISTGAQGIGLYRTEFIFLAQDHLPGEEEQVGAYRYIIERMNPRPVTFRTLDAGGDKLLESVQGGVAPDPNPFMGWRSIRMCLERPDLFLTQLRAILRASAQGKARILFPMISDVFELREAKRYLEIAREQLAAEGVPLPARLPVGAMVEIPSAVLSIRHIARECDFLSIGTNDLTQFTLAVDRSNQRISHLYDAFSPAVLQLVSQTVENTRDTGVLISVCGELAADPLGALVLIGLGVDELSMAPWSILEVKKLLRSINWLDARATAQEALAFASGREVRKMLASRYQRKLAALGLGSSVISGGSSRQRPQRGRAVAKDAV